MPKYDPQETEHTVKQLTHIANSGAPDDDFHPPITMRELRVLLAAMQDEIELRAGFVRQLNHYRQVLGDMLRYRNAGQSYQEMLAIEAALKLLGWTIIPGTDAPAATTADAPGPARP
jgi:hypothetical protein